MAWYKKLWNGVKKVAKTALPIAAVAAPFIPGIGGLISKGAGMLGGILGSSDGASSARQADTDYVMADKPPWQPPPVNVPGNSDWSKAIGGIANAGTALLSYAGQDATNQANAQMAQKQMDFQASQTGSSYQRGVADMKAAGLNPMLAYSQGGSSSGGGASAVMGNAGQAAISSGFQAAMNRAQLQQMEYQNDNLVTTNDNVAKDTALKEAQILQTAQGTATSAASAKQIEAATQKLVADTFRLEGTTPHDIRYSKASADREEYEAVLARHGVPRAANQAAAQGSWWMRNVDPYLNSIGGVVNSAGTAARLIRPR
ncbi:MAG: DNA pilot protein [Microviridae sp.]|nr:MAG: DNA pilot protein [Microviridae sp.]